MTDVVQVALLAAVPPTIVGLAAVIQAFRTHKLVNSRMTELLELTRTASKADGVLQEKHDAAIGTPTRSGET